MCTTIVLWSYQSFKQAHMAGKDLQNYPAMNGPASNDFHTSSFEPIHNPGSLDQSTPPLKSSHRTELLYSRTHGYQNSSRSKTSSSFSGSDPVEHDEEEDASRTGSSCGASSSSGYTGSWNSKARPSLEGIPHDPTVPLMAFIRRGPSGRSSSAMSDIVSWECKSKLNKTFFKERFYCNVIHHFVYLHSNN